MLGRCPCLGAVLAFCLDWHAVQAREPLKNPAYRWEDLPAIRAGVGVWSHTSKSPLNYTIMDWTNYTVKDGGDREMADYRGNPGMLVQAWFDPKMDLGNLKLYLRDLGKPDFDRPFADYFNTGSYPFPLWHHLDNMLWAFPGLAFDSLFKATVSDTSQWFQFTLHTYREERFSEALAKGELDAIAANLKKPLGSFPGSDSGSLLASDKAMMAAGETRTLFESTTGGVVRDVRLQPASIGGGILDNIRIRITTDSQVTADLPVSLFFGGYPGTDMRNAKGMPAGFDGVNLYCHFPMPFWKGMKIELQNRGPSAIEMPFRIRWSAGNPYPRDSTGTFRVRFNDNVQAAAGTLPFTNLDVDGSGLLVGCVSGLTGSIEGNFSTYVDGSRTAAIETTGGEDFFNHSYGIHPGFSQPYSGGLGPDKGYRFLIFDYIPFSSSLRFFQDHAYDFPGDRDGNLFSAIFYYHNPNPFLLSCDSLDVGDLKSEAAHAYSIVGKTRLQRDTSAYEGYYSEKLLDEGRWTDGQSAFRISIPSDNDGIRLRKRINQSAYHQEIEVFVDGNRIGLWFEQGSNYVVQYPDAGYRSVLQAYYRGKGESIPTWESGAMPAQFRDTEFEIPAEWTRGKSYLSLVLKTKGSLAVTPGDAGLTNEYRYWFYSHASPGATTALIGQAGGSRLRDSHHHEAGSLSAAGVMDFAGRGFPPKVDANGRVQRMMDALDSKTGKR